MRKTAASSVAAASAISGMTAAAEAEAAAMREHKEAKEGKRSDAAPSAAAGRRSRSNSGSGSGLGLSSGLQSEEVKEKVAEDSKDSKDSKESKDGKESKEDSGIKLAPMPSAGDSFFGFEMHTALVQVRTLLQYRRVVRESHSTLASACDVVAASARAHLGAGDGVAAAAEAGRGEGARRGGRPAARPRRRQVSSPLVGQPATHFNHQPPVLARVCRLRVLEDNYKEARKLHLRMCAFVLLCVLGDR